MLVTGGLGFIGSHVAERFYKEGYEVHIIDNMSTGNKDNIQFKHKEYLLSVEDQKCEEIFKMNDFDIVVHMAAQVSVAASIKDPRHDSEANLLGLVNILSLSERYGVKKFIFASSAAVYGMNDSVPISESAACNPVSPYGISKWVGESYCTKWNELYDLDTVCFRFSNVYGPRQGSVGEGGVISIFMRRLLEGQPIRIFGDGEQTRDFIYVTDVVDAIYRAANSTLTGIYNLSTMKETSVNHIVEALQELHAIKDIMYDEPRTGDIRHSTLDNRLVSDKLDWSYLYDIEEGLARTYEWFKSKPEDAVAQEQDKESFWSRIGLKTYLPYIENVLAFLLVVWISFSSWYDSFTVVDVKFFYIAILAILYGNRQAVISITLSIGLFVYEHLQNGREIVSLMYDTNFFFQLALYLLVGLVFGNSMERKNQLIQSQAAKLQASKDKYEFLNGIYTETRKVKSELQDRILNSDDSLGKIYSITKELESLEPEEVLTNTISVVESIMNTKAVSIYTVDRDQQYVRLVAHSKDMVTGTSKSIRVESSDYIQSMMNDRNMFINFALEPDKPLMAMLVQSKGNVVAVVMISEMKYENYSLYYRNLFKVLVDMISSALTNALAYTEVLEEERYIEQTDVLRPTAFNMILESKKLAKSKYNIDYTLMECPLDGLGFKECAATVTEMLRETDYVGLNEEGQLMVLLSNTNHQEAEGIIKRLNAQRISIQVVKGNRVYA